MEQESFLRFDEKCAEELLTRQTLESRVRTAPAGKRKERFEQDLKAFSLQGCGKLYKYFPSRFKQRASGRDPASLGIDAEFTSNTGSSGSGSGSASGGAKTDPAAKAPVEEW